MIYKTKLEMVKNALRVDEREVSLIPGMAVTTEVQTGYRKIIEYVSAPLLRYRQESAECEGAMIMCMQFCKNFDWVLYMKSLRKFKKKLSIVVPVMSFSIVGMISGCGEKYKFEKRLVSDIVYQSLIDSGVCVDLKDCHEHEYVFGEAGDKIRINIYGISDRRVCQKVLAGVIVNEKFMENSSPVMIAFYPFKKIDYIGLNGEAEDRVMYMEVDF